MIGFKECARCSGDVQAGGDRYGEYIQCLQCGHVVNVQKTSDIIQVVKGRLKAGRPRKRSRRASVA